MKRYYHNFTNEPVRYRTWLFLKESVNNSDLLWLKSLGISVRIDEPTKEIFAANGTRWEMKGKPSITLETTTDKQSSMLYLKYDNDILLIQDEIVLPNTLGTCTLSI